jgi:hypothetical protein
LLYNLNKIYPEFDRYAFTKEKERWANVKFKGKINRFTPSYDYDPDSVKLATIEEIDRLKKNQVKDKKEMMKEQQVIVLLFSFYIYFCRYMK